MFLTKPTPKRRDRRVLVRRSAWLILLMPNDKRRAAHMRAERVDQICNWWPTVVGLEMYRTFSHWQRRHGGHP